MRNFGRRKQGDKCLKGRHHKRLLCVRKKGRNEHTAVIVGLWGCGCMNWYYNFHYESSVALWAQWTSLGGKLINGRRTFSAPRELTFEVARKDLNQDERATRRLVTDDGMIKIGMSTIWTTMRKCPWLLDRNYVLCPGSSENDSVTEVKDQLGRVRPNQGTARYNVSSLSIRSNLHQSQPEGREEAVSSINGHYSITVTGIFGTE